MFSYIIAKQLSLALGFTINIINSQYKPIIFTIMIIGCVSILATFILLLFKKNNKKKKLPKKLKKTNGNYLDKNKKSNSTKITRAMKVEELNKDLEPFGFAYYPKQDIFYSIMDGWQRECGYCELYDEACAALSMIIDCEPIRFEYGGKRWLIEFWKGQYGMTTGCEIGIYNTDGPNLNIPGFFDGTFYNCVTNDEHMYLALSLRKNGELLFTRSEYHWWLTGFKLGEFSYPSELSMSIQITFTEPEMLDAFIDALTKAGYTEKEYSVNGTIVSIEYNQPHSPQPFTRTDFTELIMQTNNKRNCEAYNFATKNIYNTLDKLEYVKTQAPKMYRRILNIGNTKELFGSYKTINEFLNHK